MIDKLRKLVAESKTENALQILKADPVANAVIQNELIALMAKFNALRKKENIGLLGQDEAIQLHTQINFSLLELINEVEINATNIKSNIPQIPGGLNTAVKTVFISYNHNDVAVANRVKEKLLAENIRVLIDSEQMQAGEDIKDFIERCLRETGSVILIVSKQSLLSAWVAMEAVNSFQYEKTNIQKKFIACYINNDFFDRRFADEALDHIEAEITDIQKLISARMSKNRNIRDLQNELARITELRNNIDEIIRRLREKRCIDIAGENIEQNFQAILKAIIS